MLEFYFYSVALNGKDCQCEVQGGEVQSEDKLRTKENKDARFVYATRTAQSFGRQGK